MSNVINSGISPKIPQPNGVAGGRQAAPVGSSQASSQGLTSEQPAALSQFSGEAQLLMATVGQLKGMSGSVRSSLVAGLKQTIASGAYNPDPALVAGAVTKALTNG
jgi:anti-sigma28 factor (negative regulator of flagellin synthesis)